MQIMEINDTITKGDIITLAIVFIIVLLCYYPPIFLPLSAIYAIVIWLYNIYKVMVKFFAGKYWL